ncbi:nuclease-related domain-containing protein [Ectobacillus polymachus]|uniref:nuclease-related domain-containing protein n=1 Tax=Ectobacillus polymachus TaxID=1508806 RepID=UPI003A856FDE
MIVKKREVPLILLQLQALLRRPPLHHPKIPVLTEELKKRQSGYNGECAIDYQLSFLDQNNYFIFHDLRLQDQAHFFQMDTLLVSSKFVLIIEVKNIAGTLYFDPLFQQMIRTKDGEETAFPNPILQIQRQEHQLKNWIGEKLKNVPIFSLVVISNPQTIIRTSSKYRNLSQKLIHRDVLPVTIKQMEQKIQEPTLSERELKKVVRLLKKHHTEADTSILDRYQISPNELIIGVFCPSCQFNPLTKIHGAWFCPGCKNSWKEAHVNALTDYKLLIGSTITNRQARQFLQLPSSATTKRLLLSMNLSFTGDNKSRIYEL